MGLDRLCKDNVICCDDNCKRCANLIYQKYLEQKVEIERLNSKIQGLYKEIERIAKMTVETDRKDRSEA